MIVQGQIGERAFALVIYNHEKNWFTHLLDRSQITSCLDSKLFLTFMNQKFQFMTFTFNLPEQMFHMALVLLRQNCAKLF